MKAIVLHYEYYNNYHSKEMGAFINYIISNGGSVDFFSVKSLSQVYDGRAGERFRLKFLPRDKFDSFSNIFFILKNISQYDYLFLYPSHKNLISILLVGFLFRVKPLIMFDGYHFVGDRLNFLSKIKRTLKANLVYFFSHMLFYESSNLLNGFIFKKKLVKYLGGMASNDIDKINQLSIKFKRKKILLYPGRIMFVKGVDRLINAFLYLREHRLIDMDWSLRIIGDPVEKDFYDRIFSVSAACSMISFDEEKEGDDYYKEVLEASIVVMPTRNETMPNVFQDAFFAKRLFLTTTGARDARSAIIDPTFYCDNSEDGLIESITKIANNLDGYYSAYDRLYSNACFKVTDEFYKDVIGI